MIPIRDTTPTRNYPVVNLAIIGANILVFGVQAIQTNAHQFAYLYGLVPARYTNPDISSYFSMGHQAFSFFSFMFLHGGFLHLLGNMWSLYIFGDNVEDRLGPLRYLAFYLVCGIASGLVHFLFNTDSNVPTIGASGAIAGIMGAYFILYPRSRILTVIPILIFPYFVELPAFIFLGIWFIMQFLSAAGPGAAGIAWWAHIGGFVFGILFLAIFKAMPKTGFTERTRPATTRKRTHRLQVIHPAARGDDPHLYGSIELTAQEAVGGTRKLVNIPWGFHQRLYRVAVPPHTRNGSTLRLRGMGKITPSGQRGDLFLNVVVREAVYL